MTTIESEMNKREEEIESSLNETDNILKQIRAYR